MFFKPFSPVITSLKLWVQKWRICETCEFWPSGAQSLTNPDDTTLVAHSVVTNIANVKQISERRDCELVDVPQELGELQGLRELHLQVKLSTEDCKTITCLLKRTLDWDNQCWTWCSDHHAKKIKVREIKWSSSCLGKPADGASTKSWQPRLPQFPLYSQARQQSLGELSPVDFGKDWHRFAITLIPVVT